MKDVRVVEVPLEEIVTETQYGTAAPGNTDCRGLPMLRMNNITYDGGIDLSDLKWVELPPEDMRRVLVQRGDLLFNRTNSRELVGKTAVWNRDDTMAFAGYLIRVRLRDDLAVPGYVAAFLNSPHGKTILQHAAKPSVNMANISASDLLRLRIPLPPLSYQKRVVVILDKASAIRRKRKEAIDLTEELLRATFLEMFGDPVANSKGWEELPLEQVVADGTIVTYGIVQAGSDVPGGVPYIRTGDITDGRINVSRLLRTSAEIAAKYKRSEVRAGDIVFSIRATVGTLAVVPPELDGANLTQGTARISPGHRVLRRYLVSALRAQGTQRWLAQHVKGATFKEITLATLRMLPIMIPPKPLQARFDKIAEQIEQMAARNLAASTEADALFASLVHRAFRGEL